MNMIRSICVYCGSSPGRSETYVEAGYALGRAIAASKLRLVYGGGTKGIMGAVAAGARGAGGKVMGIIPRFLMNTEATESALARLDELIVTEDMHERKKIMYMNSDAIIVLPGGAGSLDEFFEVLTWRQIGLHEKPMFLLNTRGYWDPLLRLLDHVIEQGFAEAALASYAAVVPDSATLEQRLRAALG